jgi:multiple sugar transport system permease protein
MAPSVISSSFTPNLYAYSLAFVAQEYNYAGALSFTLGALIAGISFTVIYLSSGRKRRAK